MSYIIPQKRKQEQSEAIATSISENMESHQDENFPIKRIQNELPIRTRIGNYQNENSTIDRTRQNTSTKTNLSLTAPEFASIAQPGLIPESSKATLSGSASTFIPSAHVPSSANDPESSNGAAINSQRLGAEASGPGMGSRDDRLRYEQTPQYHGKRGKHNRPQDTSPPQFSESLPSSSTSVSTNNTPAHDVVLSFSVNEGGFFLATPVERRISETFTSPDDILNAMGIAGDLSIPNAWYQTEEYHAQPHALALTRILEHAAKVRSQFEKREEYFKIQINSLTATLDDLRRRQEQATESSAKLDDLRQQLSASQDRNQRLKAEYATSDLGRTLAQAQKLKAEKELVQIKRDWYRNRAKELQFIENADLENRIVQLEKQNTDLKVYPEELTKIHQERIQSLDSSLKAAADDRSDLQKRLANAGRQRDEALQELAGGSRGHGLFSASTSDYQKMERSYKEEIANLNEKVANLSKYELDASNLLFENKELKEEKSILQSDREKFRDQVSQLQKDRTGARRAFRELEKRDASLEALEEQKAVWEAKEADYIKQIAHKEAESAAENEKLKQKLEELHKKFEEKAWEVEKAQNELEKVKMQQIDHFLSEEDSRGREIDRNGEAPTTPPTSQSTRSSSEESGPSRTHGTPPTLLRPSASSLEPTGREDYM